MKSHHYSQHAAALRTELGHALSRDVLQALHTKNAARHLLIAARQFAILALATVVLFAWLIQVALPGGTGELDAAGRRVVHAYAAPWLTVRNSANRRTLR